MKADEKKMNMPIQECKSAMERKIKNVIKIMKVITEDLDIMILRKYSI